MPRTKFVFTSLSRLTCAAVVCLICIASVACGAPSEAQGPRLVAVSQGDGRVVAVGFRLPNSSVEAEPPANNALVAVSDDGHNWKIASVKDEAALGDVAFGAGTFVAVGGRLTQRTGIAPREETRILTSSDGMHWTRRSAKPDDILLGSVAYGNGTFVALGSGAVLRSSDGVSWEHRENHDLIGATLDFIDGQFVAWGTGASLWLSPDGVTWTERELDNVWDVWHIAMANGQWFATAVDSINSPDQLEPEGPLFLRSSDGLQWSVDRPFSAELPRDISYGASKYVAVFARRGPMLSTDGSTWSSAQTQDSHATAVLFEYGEFISVGRDGIWTSENGDDWTQRLARDEM